MKKERLIETAIISFVLATGVVGYADFVVTSRGGAGYNFGIDLINKKESDAVAYSTTTKQYYTTVEKALECTTSGGTTYVVPGKNPTISRDCVVSSGVTLCLPFYFNINNDVITVGWDGSQTNGSGDTDMGQQYFGDSCAKLANSMTSDSTSRYVELYRKSQVTLDAKLTVEQGGYVQIGGVTGQISYPVSGMTTGVYSELSMTSKATLDVFGQVTCFGYIKEANKSDNGSKVILENGSTLTEPMVMFDFVNNSTAKSFIDKWIFPVRQYDFINVQPSMKVMHGAKLNGYKDTYDGTHSTQTISYVGTSDSLFNLSSGSYVDMKYNPYSYQYTYWGDEGDTTSYLYNPSKAYDVDSYKGYTNYNFHGDMEFGKVTYTFGSNSITNESYYLPFSYHQQITLNDGTFSMNNKSFKFMPGSSLKVGQDATFNQNTCAVMFYQSLPSDLTDGSHTYYYPNIASGTTITDKGKFIVNGTYNASGGWIGGNILTENAGAIVNFDKSVTLGASTFEEGNSTSHYYKEEKVLTYHDFTDHGSFTSSKLSSGSFGWEVKKHTLSVNATAYYLWGVCWYPRYTVYLGLDGTDDTQVGTIIKQGTLSDTGKSKRNLYLSYELTEYRYFKIVGNGDCDAVSDNYQLNTWYPMTTFDITITITNN